MLNTNFCRDNIKNNCDSKYIKYEIEKNYTESNDSNSLKEISKNKLLK